MEKSSGEVVGRGHELEQSALSGPGLGASARLCAKPGRVAHFAEAACAHATGQVARVACLPEVVTWCGHGRSALDRRLRGPVPPYFFCEVV
jgi:hypothetical protein